MLETEILLRPPSLSNCGFFAIQKSQLMVAGLNMPDSPRCDDLTYGPTWPTVGTEYEHEASMLNKKSPYSVYEFGFENIRRFTNVIDASPHFFIVYVELQSVSLLGAEPSRAMEDDGACSAIWHGHSIAELLKNIREWQLVSMDPFNSDHPMATICNNFFEFLSPAQSIIDEIDAMPDMHLARFLRGDANHRQHIPDFPQISQEAQSWILDVTEQYPHVDMATRISNI